MTQKYCKYVVKSKRKCCSATKDKNENDPEKCEISLKSNRCIVKKTKTGLKKPAPKESVKKEPVAKEYTELQKSYSVESLDKVYKRYIKNDMNDDKIGRASCRERV